MIFNSGILIHYLTQLSLKQTQFLNLVLQKIK